MPKTLGQGTRARGGGSSLAHCPAPGSQRMAEQKRPPGSSPLAGNGSLGLLSKQGIVACLLLLLLKMKPLLKLAPEKEARSPKREIWLEPEGSFCQHLDRCSAQRQPRQRAKQDELPVGAAGGRARNVQAARKAPEARRAPGHILAGSCPAKAPPRPGRAETEAGASPAHTGCHEPLAGQAPWRNPSRRAGPQAAGAPRPTATMETKVSVANRGSS